MQERVNILVIDDEPGMRMTLAGVLEDEGYNVVMAEDGYKGIEAVKKTNFAIAFIDMKMPGINGVETFKEIKKISPDTVVFVMTAFFAEDQLKEAVKLGVQTVLYKPLDMELVLRLINEDMGQGIILVVDDESTTRETLKGVLEDKGYKVVVAEDGLKAIEVAKQKHFDVMFIDVVMPGIDGFKAFEEIKKADPKAHVIMMTGHDIEGFVDKALSQGAFACIPKPFDMIELLWLVTKAIKK
ncbi:MAG: response regulator [Candidatus Scalinduaceae bacterium]